MNNRRLINLSATFGAAAGSVIGSGLSLALGTDGRIPFVIAASVATGAFYKALHSYLDTNPAAEVPPHQSWELLYGGTAGSLCTLGAALTAMIT